MSRIEIQRELCIGCGKCVKECTAKNLQIIDGKAESLQKDCFECGHCYAVCPQKAVRMPDYDDSACTEAAEWKSVAPEDLLSLMQSRRSVRFFTDEPVSEEDLHLILQAGRYSPTACNMQDVHFTILKDDVTSVDREAMRYPKFGSGAVSDQSFFNGAPLVILLSAVRMENAALVASYMELMIASLGLGAFYSGFFKNTVNGNPELKKYLKIPEEKTPVICLVVGHPAVKFKRIPPRKPAEFTRF